MWPCNKVKTYEVYWIRRKCHTDIFKDGYVGITSQGVGVRFQQHKNMAKAGACHILAKALRKYDDIVVSTVLICNEQYAYYVEKILRPSVGTAWNSCAGGEVNRMLGRKHTPEAIAKISQASKTFCNSQEFKDSMAKRRGYKHTTQAKLKMSKAAQGRLPWEVSKANKNLWSLADVCHYLLVNRQISKKALADFMLLKVDSLRVISSKILNGWNPSLDLKWLEWAEKFKKESLK